MQDELSPNSLTKQNLFNHNLSQCHLNQRSGLSATMQWACSYPDPPTPFPSHSHNI